MKRRSILLVLFACGFFAISCERATREVAEKSDPADRPQYTQLASASLVPGVAYVKEVAPRGPDAPLDGAALFVTNCAACHQQNGQGVPGAFPPLDGSLYVTSDKVDRMLSIMVYGLVGPIKVKGATYASAMAPLGHLKDEELAAIASYVRSAWSNKAGPVEIKQVDEVRKKWGSRGPFTIAELGEEPNA